MFAQKIINRLSELQVDGEKFCALLKKHNAVVSGQFLLDCVLGYKFDKKNYLQIWLPDVPDGIYEYEHPLVAWMIDTYGKTVEAPYDCTWWIHGPGTEVVFHLHYNQECSKPYSNLDYHLERIYELHYHTTTFDGQNIQISDLLLDQIGFVISSNRHIGPVSYGITYVTVDVPNVDMSKYFCERIILFANFGVTIIYESLAFRCDVGPDYEPFQILNDNEKSFVVLLFHWIVQNISSRSFERLTVATILNMTKLLPVRYKKLSPSQISRLKERARMLRTQDLVPVPFL